MQQANRFNNNNNNNNSPFFLQVILQLEDFHLNLPLSFVLQDFLVRLPMHTSVLQTRIKRDNPSVWRSSPLNVHKILFLPYSSSSSSTNSSSPSSSTWFPLYLVAVPIAVVPPVAPAPPDVELVRLHVPARPRPACRHQADPVVHRPRPPTRRR